MTSLSSLTTTVIDTANEPSRMLGIFTASLPQQLNCTNNDWPKSSMICSDSAIGCSPSPDRQCICAEGYTGKADFVGSNDCHVNIAMNNAGLTIWIVSCIATAVILSMWNYPAIKVGINRYKKGEKVLPKTLGYIGFVWEGCWCAIGTSYRVLSGNRYGYDFLSSMLMAGNISFFIMAFYFFIKSWVKMSIQATSTGSKSESDYDIHRITTSLKYRQITCCGLLTLCCFLMTFITEEISDARQMLTRGLNILTGVCSLSCGFSLYRAGKVLGRAITLAGVKDIKMTKLGDNLLHSTKILTFVAVTVASGLFFISVVPFLIHYQMLVMSLSFAIAHVAPIAITLLLETPPWSNDDKILPLSSTHIATHKGIRKASVNIRNSRVSVFETTA